MEAILISSHRASSNLSSLASSLVYIYGIYGIATVAHRRLCSFADAAAGLYELEYELAATHVRGIIRSI